MHCSDNKGHRVFILKHKSSSYSEARTTHTSVSSGSEYDLTDAISPLICPPGLISASALENDPTLQDYRRGMMVIAWKNMVSQGIETPRCFFYLATALKMFKILSSHILNPL